ncbi:MAG: pentapeptide repeat-containing protein [Bauldia sp.]|nr:pentapeptide repeat-containing protein [Bauldia sp.]
MKRHVVIAALAAILAMPATAQDDPPPLPSVWDLTLGRHAAELPTAQFVDYACGTDGGPPSLPVADWTGYAACRPDAATGWHEVYFRYDDEPEYVARARTDDTRIEVYRYTSVYGHPVIATALFDDDGFLRGLRLVTDPRVDTATRALAHTLGGFLLARFDGDWRCEDTPPAEGESAYRGTYINRTCALDDGSGVTRTIATRLFRRPGQFAINPADNLPTEGYFESATRFEERLVADMPDRAERLAAIAALPPPEPDPDVLRAMDCPGCDLAAIDLKRADLRGANLAGANLAAANLHGVNLAGANLEGANLRGSNLNRAILAQANLGGADLSGAMLYAARLDGANLAGATMIGILAGNARMIRANLTGAVVNDSNLTAIRLTGAVAAGASFARSRFWEAELSGTDFTGAVFHRSDFLNAVMTAIMAPDADFTVTNLLGVDLRDADLAGADFSGARMTGAILARANIDGAIFADTLLPAGFQPPD